MNYFITGCDKNTEWQLPWFVKNFRKHSKAQLVIADFGMTTDAYMMAQIDADHVIDEQDTKGWFSKVGTMWTATKRFPGGNYCWIDTDCEIRSNPDDIFTFIEKNKLTMVVDHPWTINGSPWTRQSDVGPWYNTGVVAFQDRPGILDIWYKEIRENQNRYRGDQEALYEILNRDHMMRFIHIAEAPHRYNVLRLDMAQDRVPPKPAILHWTGRVGNEEIRRQISDN